MVAGKWTLFIDPHASAAFLTNPVHEQFPLATSVSISDHRVLLGADPNCITQSHPGPGTYTYTTTPTSLTFVLVHDVCRDRGIVLSGKWVKNR